MKPEFIVFVGGTEKEWWIQEKDRCEGRSLNRICSGTIEIEWWIWEDDTFQDRSRFYCLLHMDTNGQLIEHHVVIWLDLGMATSSSELLLNTQLLEANPITK
jgi:hypothetical protein